MYAIISEKLLQLRIKTLKHHPATRLIFHKFFTQATDRRAS